VIGAGPVGALAALYAAKRGHNVNIYELRNGESTRSLFVVKKAIRDAQPILFWITSLWN